jgi:hypothetical protein
MILETHKCGKVFCSEAGIMIGVVLFKMMSDILCYIVYLIIFTLILL